MYLHPNSLLVLAAQFVFPLEPLHWTIDNRHIMLPFALALLLVRVAAQITQNPSPCPIAFTNDTSVGPDGPWWYILQAVDWPSKPMKMIPTQAEMSMIVNKNACDSHDNCPSSDDLWEPKSKSWQYNKGSEKASADVDASAAGPVISQLLGLEGSGQYIMNRMTIYRGGDAKSDTRVNILDESAILLSNNYSITYPGGASYTLSTGFVSWMTAFLHTRISLIMTKTAFIEQPKRECHLDCPEWNINNRYETTTTCIRQQIYPV